MIVNNTFERQIIRKDKNTVVLDTYSKGREKTIHYMASLHELPIYGNYIGFVELNNS